MPDCWVEWAVKLCNIIQHSQVTPRAWHIDLVHYVHKGGSDTSLANHRPLALIEVFRKVFTSVIIGRMRRDWNRLQVLDSWESKRASSTAVIGSSYIWRFWKSCPTVLVLQSSISRLLPRSSLLPCGCWSMPTVFFLGRFGWVEDGSLAVDLSSGLSAATLASFEAWADGDGRLDWPPTSETGFLQRVLTLAAELAMGVLPAELKVNAESFVPFEDHGDSADGPDWADSWFSRMAVESLALALLALALLAPAKSCRCARGDVTLGRRSSAAAACSRRGT